MFEPEEQKIVAGLCLFFFWIVTFAATKLFLYLVIIFGLAAIFLSMSVSLLACFIFTCLLVPETRKKEEEEEPLVCSNTRKSIVSKFIRVL